MARTTSIKVLEPEVKTLPSANQVGPETRPISSVEQERTLIAVWCLILLLIVLSVIAGFILWWKVSSLSGEMHAKVASGSEPGGGAAVSRLRRQHEASRHPDHLPALGISEAVRLRPTDIDGQRM